MLWCGVVLDIRVDEIDDPQSGSCALDRVRILIDSGRERRRRWWARAFCKLRKVTQTQTLTRVTAACEGRDATIEQWAVKRNE
jgi:hypothetical protein